MFVSEFSGKHFHVSFTESNCGVYPMLLTILYKHPTYQLGSLLATFLPPFAMAPPKPTSLEVNNLVFRWPKPLFFHGFWGLMVFSRSRHHKESQEEDGEDPWFAVRLNPRHAHDELDSLFPVEAPWISLWNHPIHPQSLTY